MYTTVLEGWTLNSSNPKYLPEDYQPWRDPLFARSRLEEWGVPTHKKEYWSEGQRDRLTRIVALLNQGSVLDVGCGCGHLYSLIRGKVKSYTGIDFKSMIDICQEFFPEADWREGDVYDLSSFGLYDVVLAIQLFIHLPDFLRPLRQCWNHASKFLLFTVRTGAYKTSITVNKETGSLAHRHSRQELSDAINLLSNVGRVDVYLGNKPGRILYVKLTRMNGANTEIRPEFFELESIREI